MKKLLLHLFLLLVAFCILPPISAAADTFTVDGIKYGYNDKTETAWVDDNNKYFQGTDVVIPETVEYQSTIYRVIGIQGSAFEGCNRIISLSLPSSLEYIHADAFSQCTGLTSVEFPNSLKSLEAGAFYRCKSLVSITLPESLTSLSDARDETYLRGHTGCFEGCSSLTSVTLPSGLTHIGNKAFRSCSALTSVNLPASLESIGKEAFAYCSELKEINFPSSLQSIGKEAFRHTNQTDVVIPEKVTVLEKLTFAECSNLKNVFIPSSVTSVGEQAFARYGSEHMTITLKAILSQSDLSHLTEGIYGRIITNIHNVELSPSGWCELNSYGEKHVGVYLYDLSVKIKNYWQYLKGFSFATEPNPYWDESETTEAILTAGEGWQLPAPDANGNYFVEGLGFGEARDLYLTWNKKDETGEKQSCKITFESKTPSIFMNLQSTQATVVIESMNVIDDKTCQADARMGFSYNSWDSVNKRVVTVEKEYDGNKMILDGFPPNYKVEILPYAYFDGRKYKCPYYTIKTKPLNPVARIVAVGPTSAEVEGSYDEGDADISWIGFYDRDGAQTFNGNKATITGYIPETDYNIGFKIIAGGKEFVSQEMAFTTEPLQLTTLDPKCVSNSCAIVAAETNLSELETNAGFQWKKYDAPESLKPSEGYASIYNGMLEGYIKNLQSTSFYNVRPFYKDAADKYYYGEWVTFDPSDFSYFEPTVHTYPAEEVDGTSVTMRGYVLGGTDEITGQGFEYWELGDHVSERRNVAATGIMSVEGFGQVMRVVVDGLKEGTRYGFRTYVQTVVGKTCGEEQTFTTAGTAAADDITDDAAPAPLGYFDLCGRRYDVPRQGLNIVVYSDGSSRKFISKYYCPLNFRRQ